MCAVIAAHARELAIEEERPVHGEIREVIAAGPGVVVVHDVAGGDVGAEVRGPELELVNQDAEMHRLILALADHGGDAIENAEQGGGEIVANRDRGRPGGIAHDLGHVPDGAVERAAHDGEGDGIEVFVPHVRPPRPLPPRSVIR